MLPFSGGSFLLLVSCIIVPSLTYPSIQSYPNSDRNDVKGMLVVDVANKDSAVFKYGNKKKDIFIDFVKTGLKE